MPVDKRDLNDGPGYSAWDDEEGGCDCEECRGLKKDRTGMFGYNEDFAFCCGAYVVGEVVYGDTIKFADIKKLDDSMVLHRKEHYDKPGLGVVTITKLTPEALEEFHKLGWQDLVTWRSNHGNYPITMLAKVHEDRVYVEPA